MSLNEETITANFIFEVLGKPAEHLTETLKKIIENFDKEKSAKVIDKKINEPIALKDKPDFFSNFAEVEIEFDNLSHLILLIFKYMPAHIEIISPENLKLSNNNLNEIINELARRLHGYDEIVRIVQAEKRILERKLKDLMEKSKDKN